MNVKYKMIRCWQITGDSSGGLTVNYQFRDNIKVEWHVK